MPTTSERTSPRAYRTSFWTAYARKGGRAPTQITRHPSPRARGAPMMQKREARGSMSQSSYESDLDRNPANFQPLTPLDLSRTRGDGLSPPPGDRPRSAAAQLPGVPRPIEEARLGAGETRVRSRRHGRGHAGEHSGDARMPLRRSDVRRGAEHAEHPPRRRGARLHARPRRGEGAHRRPGILGGRSPRR